MSATTNCLGWAVYPSSVVRELEGSCDVYRLLDVSCQWVELGAGNLLIYSCEQDTTHRELLSALAGAASAAGDSASPRSGSRGRTFLPTPIPLPDLSWLDKPSLPPRSEKDFLMTLAHIEDRRWFQVISGADPERGAWSTFWGSRNPIRPGSRTVRITVGLRPGGPEPDAEALRSALSNWGLEAAKAPRPAGGLTSFAVEGFCLGGFSLPYVGWTKASAACQHRGVSILVDLGSAGREAVYWLLAELVSFSSSRCPLAFVYVDQPPGGRPGL